MEDLNKAAIKAASEGDWNKAIEINKQILSLQSNNIQALNRLAFAYLQVGNLKKAEKKYCTVLQLEPNHPVAERNLRITQQLASIKKTNKQILNRPQPIPDVFVKDPGKTRLVSLINPAIQTILDTLYSSQQVQFHVTKKSVEVRTLEGYYLGALPDDISFHLRNLIKLGNQYSIHIKNVEKKRVYVFIREIKRGKKVKLATFRTFS